MIINLSHSIDTRREVKLVGQISSAFDVEIWNDLLISTMELFDRFSNLGGTGYTVINEGGAYYQGRFEWGDGGLDRKSVV